MGDHRRFLVNSEDIAGETAVLTGGPARQITLVLRLKEGDRICLVDGQGGEHEAFIAALSKGKVTARILGSRVCPSEPGLRLALAVCPLKGDKLDLVVQKGTELGISEFAIVNSARTIPRIKGAKAEEKIARWQRIASEAAEQSGRARAPGVSGILDWEELAGRIRTCPLALLAWEAEDHVHLKDLLRAAPPVESAMLVIGPEGGLTTEEVDLARAAGAKCVSLGPRLLRSETAAIAASAAIFYELEGTL